MRASDLVSLPEGETSICWEISPETEGHGRVINFPIGRSFAHPGTDTQ